MRLISAALAFALTLSAPALGSSPKATKSDIFDDGWAMLVTRDSFTDEVICKIIRVANSDILVDKDSVYLSYKERGGIKAYEYRIDNDEPSGLILASALSIEHKAVVFLGEKYLRIMAGNRLRVRSHTSQPYHIDDDYDLRGAKRLLAKLPSFCPHN